MRALRGQVRELTQRVDTLDASLRRLEQRTEVAEQKAAESDRTGRQAEAEAEAAEAVRKSEAIFNKSVRK